MPPPPSSNRKQSRGPKTGAVLRTPKRTRMRNHPRRFSGAPGPDLGLHRRRRQEVPTETRHHGRPATRLVTHDVASTPKAPVRARGKPSPWKPPPCVAYNVTRPEAGPRRRPDETQPGSPSDREAHDEVQQGRGGRSTPEAPVGMQGKPVHAGGPTSTIQ